LESRILRRLEVEHGLLMLEEGHSVCQTLPKDDHSFTGVYLCQERQVENFPEFWEEALCQDL